MEGWSTDAHDPDSVTWDYVDSAYDFVQRLLAAVPCAESAAVTVRQVREELRRGREEIRPVTPLRATGHDERPTNARLILSPAAC